MKHLLSFQSLVSKLILKNILKGIPVVCPLILNDAY